MKKWIRLVIAALFIQFLVSAGPATAATTPFRITSATTKGLAASITWTSSKLGAKEFFEVELSKLSTDGKTSVPIKSIKTKSLSSSLTLNTFTNYRVRVHKTLTPKVWTQYATILTSSEAVANIKATDITYTTANLTWDEVVGATGYEVSYAGLTKISLSNKILLTGLQASSSYDITIRAAGNGRKGADSDLFNLTSNSAAPQNLVANGITKTSFVLSWLGVPGADSYNIYKEGKIVATTKLPTFTVSALTPGSKSNYSVAAIFGTSVTLVSDKIEVSTLIDRPAIPVLSAITSQGVTVGWAVDINATSYTVNIYDSLGTTVVKTSTVAGSLNSTTFTGLSALSSYTVGIVNNYTDASSKESPLATFVTLKQTMTGIATTNITTTTVTLGWSALAVATSYEIYKDGVSLVTGIATTSTSYTFSSLAPGQTYRLGVRAVYADGGKVTSYTDISEVIATTAIDPTYKPVISTAPVITLPYANVPIIGATLVVNTGTWTSVPAVSSYSYQWQRSLDAGTTWSDLPGAITSSYVVTVSDNSFLLRAKISATNVNGTGVTYTAPSGAVSSVYNIQVPIVRGSAVVGQILEISDGTWSSMYPITLSYKWITSRTGTYISGEISPTYTVAATEAGFVISAQVTASTTYGFLAVNSPTRGFVTIVGNTVLPTISGTLRVGGTLTVSDGTWLNSVSGSVITYQWQSSSDGILWDSIAGATSSSYVLKLAQSGLFIRAQVFNTKTSLTVLANSAPTAVVPVLNLVNTITPAITGAWTVGTTLNVSTGTWSASGTFTYQWQKSSDNSTWTDISGATGSSYVLTSSEASKYVRAQVTNTTSSGAGIAYSASTSKVGAPYNTAAPAITGTVKVGSTQTATTGTWSNTPTSYSYQWQKSADGISWINISGETAATYVPTFDIANLQIRIVVSGINAVDTATVTSAVIQSFLPPQATVVPAISGTSTVGQTLTSSAGTWPSTVSGYAYQWQKSSDNGVTWANISGASASTYVLVAADAGYVVRSQVSLTTDTGTSAAYSLATANIAP
jgi:hypothetical protein